MASQPADYLLKEEKSISYDLENLPMSADGLEGFEWPISYKDMVEAGLKLEYSVTDLLREYPDQKGALPYKIMKQLFLNKVCGYFQAHILNSKMAAKDAEFKNIPDKFEIWKDVFENIEARPEPFLNGLRFGKKIKILSPQNILKKLANPKRAFSIFKKMRLGDKAIMIDGLYIGTPDAIDLEKDIVVTQRMDITHAHAKLVNDKVYYCPSQFWFSEITQKDIDQHSGAAINPALSGQILELVAQLYGSYGLELPEHTKKTLRGFLDESILLIAIHYTRLMRRDDLPQRLWTGTSGNVWDLMLRLAVIERGGKVSAHDHAGGTAFTLSPQLGGVELWGADVFTVYNERQAEIIRQNAPEWPRLDKAPMAIQTVNVQPRRLKENPDSSATIKNILLFSTWYTGDLGRSYPIYPYLQYMDWQARLISQLVGRGYHVLLKPHPESVVATPSGFRKLGAEIITGHFEEMDIKIDLYMLDMVKTSVFKPLLYTNKPIMIADFEYHSWEQSAQAALEERCGYVRGDISGNRFSVHWDSFFEELEGAPEKVNSDTLTSNFLD